MNKFHKGAPPSIGWWPATNLPEMNKLLDKEELPHRWWDGECWSRPAYKYSTAERAAWVSDSKAEDSKNIQWTSRWWQ